MPLNPILYESPANSGGNNGAPPAVYDPVWPVYTNLTTGQIAAFQAFPQDLIRYAGQSRWTKEISRFTVSGILLDMSSDSQRKIATLKQAFDSGTFTGTVAFVALNGVHTVSSSDVNAIFAACANRIQATYTALAQVVTGAGTTITTRAQIDALFAAIT